MTHGVVKVKIDEDYSIEQSKQDDTVCFVRYEAYTTENGEWQQLPKMSFTAKVYGQANYNQRFRIGGLVLEYLVQCKRKGTLKTATIEGSSWVGIERI